MSVRKVVGNVGNKKGLYLGIKIQIVFNEEHPFVYAGPPLITYSELQRGVDFGKWEKSCCEGPYRLRLKTSFEEKLDELEELEKICEGN